MLNYLTDFNGVILFIQLQHHNWDINGFVFFVNPADGYVHWIFIVFITGTYMMFMGYSCVSWDINGDIN